jgi:aminotransferase in exopolysaccharide biosynthesis
MFNEVVEFIKALYPDQVPVPLHAPVFFGKEKEYLIDCIDSTFVSYIGKYVTKFEQVTAEFTGAKFAIAVTNGTVALQVGLQIAGVKYGDEVITQPLTFVATANAISHCGAKPVFLDVDLDTMGMSPDKLENWLKKNIETDRKTGKPFNRITKKNISAIVPMHSFGFPCRIDEIVEIGNQYNLPVIEDSAESLGSYYKGKHTGTFGLAGILSYNGNKTITTGGGGMIITNSEYFANQVKHLTTTAKLPHKYEFVHDEVAYNFRLPNVNAAVGLAQMENIETYLQNKKKTAAKYREFFNNTKIDFFDEPLNSSSNFWLNTILLKDFNERNKFLNFTIDNGVNTRPVWRLMSKLNIYRECQMDNLENANNLEERVVNIPSGYRN